jgi:hypothetical protein
MRWHMSNRARDEVDFFNLALPKTGPGRRVDHLR